MSIVSICGLLVATSSTALTASSTQAVSSVSTSASEAATSTLTIALEIPSATARSLATVAYKDYRTRWTYDRLGWVDYATTAAVGAGWYVVEFHSSGASEPRWTGGILFDDQLRDAFVGGSIKTRDDAAVVSDIFALAPQAMLWVDIGIVLLTDRLNIETAWHMTVINLQAAALVGLVTRLGHHYVARQRPDVEPCRLDGNYNGTCFGGSNSSFPSGHASASFMGAGLVCAHHLHLPIYGGGAPDYAACGLAMAMASANAISRLVADRHYVSDVVAGIGIGLAGGFMLPLLAHYRPPISDEARLAIVPLSAEGTQGLAVVGIW